MNMMPEAMFAIATLSMAVTTIAAAMGATVRTDLDRPIARETRPVVSTRARRQATQISAVSRPIKPIGLQYLPALARARILRLQTSHLTVATPRRRQVRQ
jgi:hypothetical protein